MIKAFDDYTLLVGTHGRRGSIWRGPDHLLVVEGSGALYSLSESYRRIDYENIQALSMVRTQWWGWLLAACLVPMVLSGLFLSAVLGAASGPAAATSIPVLVGLAFLIVPAVLLAVHLARGRTVRCTLQTAVQNLRLRPLTREPNAHRVIAEIAEICRQHQRSIAPPPLNEPSAPLPSIEKSS